MLTKTFRCLATWLAAILLISSTSQTACAVDYFWNVAGPDDWNTGSNWDASDDAFDGMVPSGGGGNHAYVNNGGTAEISADIEDFQDIFVAAGAETSGTLNQTGGNTFQGTGSWMFVGQDGGTGTYNLSGGTQNKAQLHIGRGTDGDGTLNMSGTGAVDGEQLNIGVDGGVGSASLSENATVTTTGLNVGVGGGVGTANLSENATVTTTGLVQVQNGSMTVTDDASISAGGEFWVGQGAGSTATLDMDSGNIEVSDWIAVGREGGTGTVNLSGDARLAKVGADDRFITLGGLGADGGGTINIQDDAVLESDTGMVISETASRYGIVNQSGGTVNLHDFDNEGFGKSLHVDYAGEGLGEYHLTGGTLNAETIDATSGVFEFAGGTLSATTFEGSLTQGGGTLSPGDSPGSTTVMGDYSLDSGDLDIEIEGSAPGTGYDQLVVTGDVSLAGELSLSLGFVPSTGEEFTIIDNQGANPVSGMFTGLGEGSTVSAGGFPFTISYLGGTDNDVVLTSVIPEPNAIVLLVLGLAGLIGNRRRR